MKFAQQYLSYYHRAWELLSNLIPHPLLLNLNKIIIIGHGGCSPGVWLSRLLSFSAIWVCAAVKDMVFKPFSLEYGKARREF